MSKLRIVTLEPESSNMRTGDPSTVPKIVTVSASELGACCIGVPSEAGPGTPVSFPTRGDHGTRTPIFRGNAVNMS